MEKKDTTYQRLQRENAELKQDLYYIIKHPDTEKGIIAKMKHKVNFDLLDVVWFGSPTS